MSYLCSGKKSVTNMKRKLVLFMLFGIALSSLAQELRMGMAKKVNGKDYYVPVELESNFLIV